MSRLATLLATSLALVGCATNESSQSLANHNPLDLEGCVKIEGSDIGRDDLAVELGDRSVTFTSWISKVGEANEYVGFTLSASAQFYIKAGNNTDNLFEGTGTSWVNPFGTSGPDAKAISNIQICDIAEPEPPPCDAGCQPPPPDEEPCDAGCQPPPPPEEEPCDAGCQPPPPPDGDEPCEDPDHDHEDDAGPGNGNGNGHGNGHGHGHD